MLTILKNNGANTIRLQLWVDPSDEHAGFNKVNQFYTALKANGFKIWLTLHYFDTWADPDHQELPNQWQGMNFSELKNSVYNYAEEIMAVLQPDFIQIGNEINASFFHLFGIH